MTALSLPRITSADALFAALMLTLTRMPSDKSRRVITLLISSRVTSLLETPAAEARAVLKSVCLSFVNAANDRASVNVNLTTNDFASEGETVDIEPVSIVQFALAMLPGTALLPTSHDAHVAMDAAPEAGEKVFAGHLMHVLSDEAPLDAENLPDWHLVHPTAPAIVEYLPSTQSEHMPEPIIAENVPNGHICLSAAPPTQ